MAATKLLMHQLMTSAPHAITLGGHPGRLVPSDQCALNYLCKIHVLLANQIMLTVAHMHTKEGPRYSYSSYPHTYMKVKRKHQ